MRGFYKEPQPFKDALGEISTEMLRECTEAFANKFDPPLLFDKKVGAFFYEADQKVFEGYLLGRMDALSSSIEAPVISHDGSNRLLDTPQQSKDVFDIAKAKQEYVEYPMDGNSFGGAEPTPEPEENVSVRLPKRIVEFLTDFAKTELNKLAAAT